MTAAVLLAALLALLPPLPVAMRRCVEARHAAIVAALDDASARTGVPVAVLGVAGMLESHLGCDRASGGSWGAPLDRAHRHTAGGPMHAARALASGYRVCGSTLGALSRFRCGLCRCRRIVGYSPSFAARLAVRVEQRAGVAAGGAQ